MFAVKFDVFIYLLLKRITRGFIYHFYQFYILLTYVPQFIYFSIHNTSMTEVNDMNHIQFLRSPFHIQFFFLAYKNSSLERVHLRCWGKTGELFFLWLHILIWKIFLLYFNICTLNRWTVWQMSERLTLLHDSLLLLCVTCTQCMRLCFKSFFLKNFFPSSTPKRELMA